ncbi:ribosome biogenesis protein Nop53/GLTSCR2 [Gongronella butleri]|nr:ribosome biogenesis protein Nop53/GLTSCR2 [Gongronella butleri]
MAPAAKKETVTEPAKKVQTSRKGKKAWRKNIDIQDVDTGLEALRSEERVRGTVEDLPDEEHFVLDTTADEKVARQVRAQRTLKVDEILAERSAVPAVGRFVQEKKVVTQGEESKAQKQQINKLAKRKARGLPVKPKKKAKTTAKPSYDLWDEPKADEADEVEEEAVPGQARKVKAPSTMGMIPKAAKHHAAVAVPHAGASYNPTQDDHQALIQHAADIEFAKIKAAKKIEQQLAKPTGQALPEASEVDDGKDDDEEEEPASGDDDDDDDDKATGKRKTTAQRNREKRRRAMLAEHADRQIIKRIGKQIGGIDATAQQLVDKEAQIEVNTAARIARKEEREKQGRRAIGTGHVMEPNVEVQLEDELSESLRQLKPEGNVFTDRFASLQKRNIIVPPSQKKNPSRRYALKVYERRSYKNFDLMEKKKKQ